MSFHAGATLVGPTGAGKSTCYRILSRIMTSLHRAGSKNEQYQEVAETNPAHHKAASTARSTWSRKNGDGLASTIMYAVNEETPIRKWACPTGPSTRCGSRT